MQKAAAENANAALRQRHTVQKAVGLADLIFQRYGIQPDRVLRQKSGQPLQLPGMPLVQLLPPSDLLDQIGKPLQKSGRHIVDLILSCMYGEKVLVMGKGAGLPHQMGKPLLYFFFFSRSGSKRTSSDISKSIFRRVSGRAADFRKKRPYSQTAAVKNTMQNQKTKSSVTNSS